MTVSHASFSLNCYIAPTYSSRLLSQLYYYKCLRGNKFTTLRSISWKDLPLHPFLSKIANFFDVSPQKPTTGTNMLFLSRCFNVYVIHPFLEFIRQHKHDIRGWNSASYYQVSFPKGFLTYSLRWLSLLICTICGLCKDINLLHGLIFALEAFKSSPFIWHESKRGEASGKFRKLCPLHSVPERQSSIFLIRPKFEFDSQALIWICYHSHDMFA